MQHRVRLTVSFVILMCIGLMPNLVTAEPDSLMHVSVAFGRGLNTAQSGNVLNHVVIPDIIKVKEDGVVHFLVSGFHQLFAYEMGKGLEDLSVPAAGTFIDDLGGLLYSGIPPAGGPLGTAGTTNPSNGSNRVESVSFAKKGTYLVICNVRSHFNDGMYAFVKVLP